MWTWGRYRWETIRLKITSYILRLPWLGGKESACQCRRCEFDPWVGKFPWRRKWQLALVFLPGVSHGQRSLVGYSPWCRKESDTTWAQHRLQNMIREKPHMVNRPRWRKVFHRLPQTALLSSKTQKGHILAWALATWLPFRKEIRPRF